MTEPQATAPTYVQGGRRGEPTEPGLRAGAKFKRLPPNSDGIGVPIHAVDPATGAARCGALVELVTDKEWPPPMGRCLECRDLIRDGG